MVKKKVGKGLLFPEQENVDKPDQVVQPVKPVKPVNVVSQIDTVNIAKNAKRVGNSGSSYLEVNLTNGQKIHASSGSMLFMTGAIDMPESKFDGIGKLFAGEHIVHQEYTATGSGTIAFGLDFPNDIIRIEILPGVKYRLSRYSYLASTVNIKISATTQMKGIFGIGQSEGFILPVAENISNKPGYIWLCAYGTFQMKRLTNGQSFIVDNGLFLACDDRRQYDVIKIGKSYFSALINKEGFAMKFTGPCDIYIQSKNMDGFISFISSQLPSQNKEGVINGVANLFEGGNEKKRVVRKRK